MRRMRTIARSRIGRNMTDVLKRKIDYWCVLWKIEKREMGISCFQGEMNIAFSTFCVDLAIGSSFKHVFLFVVSVLYIHQN